MKKFDAWKLQAADGCKIMVNHQSWVACCTAACCPMFKLELFSSRLSGRHKRKLPEEYWKLKTSPLVISWRVWIGIVTKPRSKPVGHRTWRGVVLAVLKGWSYAMRLLGRTTRDGPEYSAFATVALFFSIFFLKRYAAQIELHVRSSAPKIGYLVHFWGKKDPLFPIFCQR